MKDSVEVSVFAVSTSECRRLFPTNHAFSDHGHCGGCCCKTSTGSTARPTCTTFDFTSNGRVSKKTGGRKEVGTSLKQLWPPSVIHQTFLIREPSLHVHYACFYEISDFRPAFIGRSGSELDF